MTARKSALRRFRYPGEPRAKVVRQWRLLDDKRVRLTYLPRQRDEGQRGVIVELPLCENLVMAIEVLADMEGLFRGWPAEFLKFEITKLAERLHDKGHMAAEYRKRLRARFKREGRPWND